MNYNDELNEEHRASLMRSCVRRLAESDSSDALPVMTIRVKTLISLLNDAGARWRAEGEIERLRHSPDSGPGR